MVFLTPRIRRGINWGEWPTGLRRAKIEKGEAGRNTTVTTETSRSMVRGLPAFSLYRSLKTSLPSLLSTILGLRRLEGLDVAVLQSSVAVVVEVEISEEDEVPFSGWADVEVSKGTMISEADEAVVADGSVGKIMINLSATGTLPLL